jgi:nicotinamidase-related amidase
VAADPPSGTITVRRQVPVEVATQTKVPDAPPGKIVKVEINTVWKSKTEEMSLKPERSAIIICDMWDNHWCQSAATRCDALAKSTAPLIEAARKAGVTIIHCPSDTMDFYKESKARQRTLALKQVEPPKNKDLPNPPLPIDDTAGGCDDTVPVKFFKAWKRQHEAITVDEDKDFVTDKGADVFNIIKDKNIETVLVLGVHTNMCVLNRTFAIKQLRRWDINCLLVRDLTDAMYDPKKKPFVTHEKGTQLVIGYIEQNWCPSCCSRDLFKAFQK